MKLPRYFVFKSVGIIFLLLFIVFAQLQWDMVARVNATRQFPGNTTRVNVASDGTQTGAANSGYSSISADGRYVAFGTYADNLVPGDTNGLYDVFVHDLQTGETTRISVASDGTEENAPSYDPAISADGRYVAFYSLASNFVAQDPNDHTGNIFVHDRQTGETTRVSVASDGTQANNASASPSISADGRYVAFASLASNLVPGDTNGITDIFVHDRQTGETTRVSVSSDGSQGNAWSGEVSINADGRYVAFVSLASNLAPGKPNSAYEVFVHDRQTAVTSWVSVTNDNIHQASASPNISADGRYVAYQSDASDLVSNDTNGFTDVFVYDSQTGITTIVSLASDGTRTNNVSQHPSINADGTYVAFISHATNLVDRDTNGVDDIFLHDRQTGETTRVSVGNGGVQANRDSLFYNDISADGRYVAYVSGATNLVTQDTNGASDVFVHDRLGVPGQ